MKAFWTEGFPTEQRGVGGHFTLLSRLIELQMLLISVLVRPCMKFFFFQDVHVGNSTIVRAERSLPRLKRLQDVLTELYVKLLRHVASGSHCVRLGVRQIGKAGEVGAALSGHGV